MKKTTQQHKTPVYDATKECKPFDNRGPGGALVKPALRLHPNKHTHEKRLRYQQAMEKLERERSGEIVTE
jgi:hypothetical protein